MQIYFEIAQTERILQKAGGRGIRGSENEVLAQKGRGILRVF